jgi:hypothetical protein
MLEKIRTRFKDGCFRLLLVGTLLLLLTMIATQAGISKGRSMERQEVAMEKAVLATTIELFKDESAACVGFRGERSTRPTMLRSEQNATGEGR